MGRILAIDYGRKRTGLAVTDILKITPGALETVPSHLVLQFIADYCAKEPVDLILLGYPKQMNNEPSESMKYIEPFHRSLIKRLPDIPVEFVDERFTSALAHKAMLEGGLGRKDRQNKALVDKTAAVIILQSYMDSTRFHQKY